MSRWSGDPKDFLHELTALTNALLPELGGSFVHLGVLAFCCTGSGWKNRSVAHGNVEAIDGKQWYDEALDFAVRMYPVFGQAKFGKKGGVLTAELLFKAEDLNVEVSKAAGDLLGISDDSKACGQHVRSWRSTGVAVQVGVHLGAVFLLETNQHPKFEAEKPCRKSQGMRTPRFPDYGP